MTDYASIGAARVRYCHCHDEPGETFAPTTVLDHPPNPARISAGQGFVHALIGSIRGRFAQQPMLVGNHGTHPHIIGGIAVGAQADAGPLDRLQNEVLGPIDSKLFPFATLAGIGVGVIGTWMVLDAMQAAKDTKKFNAGKAAAPMAAAGDRGRYRRRWY